MMDKQKLNELMKLKEEINLEREQIEKQGYDLNKRKWKLYHEMDQLNENGGSFESIKQVEKSIEDIENVLGDLHKKSITLFRQGEKIKYQILYLYPPVKESESIDLRYLPDSPYYYIYLHQTDTIIGNIIYSGYHINNVSRDIGCTIEEEYRGHHYAYEALSLFCEVLEEKGVPDFWASTYKNNVASKKNIERLGGVLQDEVDGVLFYECSTLKKDKNNKK